MAFPGYGDPSILQLIETSPPFPASNQVLIRVKAASVNPVDWKLHNGSLRFIAPRQFPSIPGFDVAGEVVACGLEAHGFQKGDRVIAYVPAAHCGAFAEFVAVDGNCVAKLPERISFREGAALPLAGTTALQALRNHGQVQSGQRVLVLGASGGVGLFAVQIAIAFGAEVTACCSSVNFGLAQSVGAQRVIDYRNRAGLGFGESYDLILDCVGAYRFPKICSLMKPKGVFVALLPNPEILFYSMVLPLYSQQRIHLTLARANAVDLEYLVAMMLHDQLKVVIDRVYALEDLALAFRRSQTGRACGKIVVDV